MRIKKKKLKKPRLKKKVRRLKKALKKPQKVLFKIKPLEWTKKVKIKKPSKPAKPLVKKTKSIKAVKPKKPKSVKPIESPAYKARIKVIGIGGGGSSIVSEIAPEIKKVTFVVANTDFQALKEAAKGIRHFQFGKSITQGLGTGMNPELGEQAAESDKEKIKELLKETDFCILISCLGGGTGSGASPVFAEILKKLRIPTLGIFTLPFEFEKEKKAQIAKDSLEKLRQNLNALVIIPNQKIFQIIDKNTPLKEALSVINKNLAKSLEGLIALIYSPGLINVDFADLKTILAGKGRLAYLNSAEIKNPNQIEDLTKRVLQNPLSPYSVQGAKEILFNIDGGLNLNMEQVEQIGKTITSSINLRARVAFGITQNKKEGIKITLLANGCKWEEWEGTKEKPKRKFKESKEEPKKEQTLIAKAQEKIEEPKLEKPKKVKKRKKLKKPSQTTIYSPPSIEKSELKEAVKIQVRQNALKVRNVAQEEEKKMLAREKKWETPAFLRRNSGGENSE